ncbi:unnamed protein product [Discosporangium mesarthrocarpum]
MTTRIGVVAIGRNEGDRLRACLESARRDCEAVVYVDSGSSDDSVAMARSLGAEVVDLDLSIPFTAARARNAGFERLCREWPDLAYVQFVDGDCELEAGWIGAAAEVLDADGWAVVCGRRRERHPEASIYNRLCDMEWDTPIGPAAACGGDAMMRVDVLQQVGGFSEDLIAGEEPELCVRIAEAGGRILRMDAPMTIHDAQLLSLSQWWQRGKRAGHAEAEGAERHPEANDRRNARDVRSAWIWGGLLPATALVPAPFTSGLSLLLLLVWPLQILRIGLRRPRPNFSLGENLLFGLDCVAGKAAHLAGVLRYLRGRATGRRSRLIEYKGGAR